MQFKPLGAVNKSGTDRVRLSSMWASSTNGISVMTGDGSGGGLNSSSRGGMAIVMLC